MTEPVTMKRPPLSGPGSDLDAQKAYAVHISGKDEEFFAEMKRADVIAFIDSWADPDKPKQAPEGVTPIDEPVHKTPQGLPAWSVPVEGGYVAEHEMQRFEREQFERSRTQRG
ncbi:hypothetical protein ACIRG5_42350 [Lentzea sp. NPDC102401]|uniref:hypothetical protein n=1 Tax=Lentzea sp. NPDC102401 TaxID=3364128 RepID=UPI003827332C